jgi:hypothetical protein
MVAAAREGRHKIRLSGRLLHFSNAGSAGVPSEMRIDPRVDAVQPSVDRVEPRVDPPESRLQATLQGVEPSVHLTGKTIESSVHLAAQPLESNVHITGKTIEPSVRMAGKTIEPSVRMAGKTIYPASYRVDPGTQCVHPGAQVKEGPERRRGQQADRGPDGGRHRDDCSTGV